MPDFSTFSHATGKARVIYHCHCCLEQLGSWHGCWRTKEEKVIQVMQLVLDTCPAQCPTAVFELCLSKEKVVKLKVLLGTWASSKTRKELELLFRLSVTVVFDFSTETFRIIARF